MKKIFSNNNFKNSKFSILIFTAFFIVFGFYSFALSAQNNFLKVVKSGNGSGVVKLESSGVSDIVCKFNKENDSSCGGGYAKGSDVVVTATSDNGSSFQGWGGACSGNNSICSVSKLNNDKEITAFFTLGGNNSSAGGSYNLVLEKSNGNGKGVIEGEVLEIGKTLPSNFTCYLKSSGSSCSYKYPSGSSVKLTIVPDSGSEFSISGDCSGSNVKCDLSMNSDKKVIADFNASNDPAPKINFFYSNPSVVKVGKSSLIRGQASNISKCILASFDDKTLGTYGYPNIFNSASEYYWRDVASDFTWSTVLADMGVYNYTLFCRGLGSYDNPFFDNGIVRSDIVLDVIDNVNLNITKSGGGTGIVRSSTFSPSFAWANNGPVKGDPRYTGYCKAGYSYVKSHSCNSLTVGSKVTDGTEMGGTYGDSGDAFPVYDGLKTGTAREYTNSCSLGLRSGGQVNDWQCKDKVYDIDCGYMCSSSYETGSNKKITLTAIAGSGSSFGKWSGVVCEEGKNNGNTCTVTMDLKKNVNAEFNVCATCSSSSSSVNPETVFYHNGMEQKYTVPSGINSVKITTYGAQGGGGTGGYGGKTSGTLKVTPGETLYVYVGGQDGYNGGGSTGTFLGSSRTGGGASDVRQGGNSLSNRVIVAGGGGGRGYEETDHPGGAGGGLSGASGSGPYSGFGGSKTSGGAGGQGNEPGLPGSLGIGGKPSRKSGGGGGGYYGGGGGGDSTANGDQTSGGGGGSSYFDSSMTNTLTEAGVNYGDGEVRIKIIN